MLINIEDSKIASEFISFRDELFMELLSDFQISCAVIESIQNTFIQNSILNTCLSIQK